MDSETFLQKAERLRAVLDRLSDSPPLPPDEATARETIAIAVWLHDEFGPSTPEDLPLSV
ncbi:MAG: hypothetical protein V4773_08785 [Verrucomicrobiota bacterium]